MAWVFFRAENFAQAQAVLLALFGATDVHSLSVVVFADLNPLLVSLALAALIAFFAPNSNEITRKLTAQPIVAKGINWYAISGLLAALSLSHLYANGSHAFIYFQF